MKNFIFDAHQDVLWHEQNVKKNKQTGIKMLIGSPIKLAVASVFIDPDQLKKSKKKEIKLVEDQIGKYLSLIKKNRKLSLIKDKSDVRKVISSNLTGILIHIEGLDFIDKYSVDILNKFYEMGLRSVGLVWGRKNNICSDVKSRGGLTELGKEFVKKCNTLGVIIDMSHANEKSFDDVLEISRRPIMISHGNCYSLCRRKRNIKDRQIRKIRKTNGVQGIFFSRGYVSRRKNISINDAVDHFMHIYSLAPDSVMIGSDFGGITVKLIDDLENVNDLAVLLEEIRKRTSRKVMQKIAYENFLDFLKRIL